MKIMLFILLFISFNVLKAQENKPFTNFDIGFYGGVNFYDTENIGGDFLVELKTNLMPSLQLKASAGYFKSSEPFTDTVRTYSPNPFPDSIPTYGAGKYNYESKDYDIFPLGLGFQYNFTQSIFSPYVSIDAVYNIINTFLDTAPGVFWSYNSVEEIPAEFKQEQKPVELPENSFGIMLGAGTSYQISSKVNLDIRYVFKYDSQIVNTHHFIVGIYF